MWDPRFMNPTGALEPPGDSGRIVWGIFVLTMGARERTRGCSPHVVRAELSRGFFHVDSGGSFILSAGVAPEPLGDSSRIVWGVLLAGVCACILVEMELSTKVPCVAEAVFSDRRAAEVVSFRDPASRCSWIQASLQPAQPRQFSFGDRARQSSRILASVQPA